MTLAETCDRIEAALERRSRFESIWRCVCGPRDIELRQELEMHLGTLVELGELKHPRHTRWSSEFRETCERFEALKARVVEAVK